MTQPERILDAVQDLVVAQGRLPSIVEIARVVGLTKQGVLHYFPTRAALDAAVVARALARVEAAMEEAAAEGSPTATYLSLSTPDAEDRAAVAVLAASGRAAEGPPADLARAVSRWEDLIAAELGDPVRAEVVRLVGDGLFGEALVTGAPPSPDRVARLVAHLRASTGGSRR